MYEINLTKKNYSTDIISGHLKMGGKNPEGAEINANSMYLTFDGKPWIPVMGEFHFSRYPNEYWEEEILKIKAAGINVIATYVFWNHHEEIEGEFDWTGNRNLRKFVELCGKHEMYVYPRLGPWSHGECRNGGFPDWLLGRCKLRTNDEVYLGYAKRLYEEIAKQIKGLLFKDGGPVIGIQLENELKSNSEHLLKLKQMAIELGFEVPLYTVTGWGGVGNAEIPKDEVIPLFGGYPDHPWAGHAEMLYPKDKYFFHHVRNDSTIGSDLFGTDGIEKALDMEDIKRYPYGACEVGPGVQVTHHRRPIIAADDAAAMAMLKIANGNNLVGYYVFHGGSNPIGKKSTLQESKETKYPNNLPVISYDFQAPIGEFGQIKDTYHVLRNIHMFINDFGKELAPMVSVLPEDKPVDFYDVTTLRYAARVKDDAGYLFFNNYQRHANMTDKENIKIKLKLENEVLEVPKKEFTLKSGVYFFCPFNMNINGSILKYAMVQPLCKIQEENEEVYFFSEVEGVKAEYAFDRKTFSKIEVTSGVMNINEEVTVVSELKAGKACVIKLTSFSGKSVRIVTLTKKQALASYKGKVLGKERLIITEANVAFEEDKFYLYGIDKNDIGFSIFPRFNNKVEYTSQSKVLFKGKNEHIDCKEIEGSQGVEDGIFMHYALTLEEKNIEVQIDINNEYHLDSTYFKYLFTEDSSKDVSPEWCIKLPKDSLRDVKDILLKIYYEGDVAQAYLNGRLIADDFYKGIPFEIGLSRFKEELKNANLILKISPFKKDAPIYLQNVPEIKDKSARIVKVEAVPEYMAEVKISKDKLI